MQVSIETTSGLERKMTLGVPAERIDAEVDEHLERRDGAWRWRLSRAQ